MNPRTAKQRNNWTVERPNDGNIEQQTEQERPQLEQNNVPN